MYRILLLLILTWLSNNTITAQNNEGTKTAPVELSKESKKRIKAELKEYLSNPQKYLADQEEKKNRIKTAEKELEEIKTGLRIEKRDLEYARDSVNLLIAQIEELKKNPVVVEDTTPKEASAMASGDCMKMPDKGTFYKVQMGNFATYTPSGFNGLKTFNTEAGPKNTRRFTAGYFNDLEEAAKFTEDIRKLGIKGAFVCQYKDGQRNEAFDLTKVPGGAATSAPVKSDKPAAAKKSTEPTGEKNPVQKPSSPNAGFNKTNK